MSRWQELLDCWQYLSGWDKLQVRVWIWNRRSGQYVMPVFVGLVAFLFGMTVNNFIAVLLGVIVYVYSVLLWHH